MDILSEIVTVKHDEVKKLRDRYRRTSFNDFSHFDRTVLSMAEALTANKDLAIIAEVKKASPSAGIIRHDFNHQRIAEIYQENGAKAISVLTDRNFFQGDINFLADIARDRQVPLLRKDFIIDEWQVYEAKAHGADCILLICEILEQNQLSELTQAAFETGLEVLTEMHSAQELKKIDMNQQRILGINNRDLATFKVDIDTTLRVAEKIPEDRIIVSESGLKTQEDFKRLHDSPVSAVLVGEHLMRAQDIGGELRQCVEWGQRAG